MIRVAREDRALHEHAYGRKDAQGRESRLALWNHPGDDLFGMVCARGESSTPWSRSSTARSIITTRS